MHHIFSTVVFFAINGNVLLFRVYFCPLQNILI